MTENLRAIPGYETEYLPWAQRIIIAQEVASMIEFVEADRVSLGVAALLFRPPLDILEAQITLPERTINPYEGKRETVRMKAELQGTTLRTLLLQSTDSRAVFLNTESEELPIRYSDSFSRKRDQVVKRPDIRTFSEKLIMRTAYAIGNFVETELAVGLIPEDSLDWSIEESDLSAPTINALKKAGITTFGDLGILSTSQIKEIPRLGRGCVKDIKLELDSRGWLAQPFRNDC